MGWWTKLLKRSHTAQERTGVSPDNAAGSHVWSVILPEYASVLRNPSRQSDGFVQGYPVHSFSTAGLSIYLAEARPTVATYVGKVFYGAQLKSDVFGRQFEADLQLSGVVVREHMQSEDPVRMATLSFEFVGLSEEKRNYFLPKTSQ
ncbi:MAG: hypothetical protein HY537_17160 [Deltaproteobacteria bacterium]|nr:hypothetical protein [Deltaproteobacteria bacterium]